MPQSSWSGSSKSWRTSTTCKRSSQMLTSTTRCWPRPCSAGGEANMIAIGFDPGTARLGYGVIESEPDPQAIDFGVIVTDPGEPMARRLLVIHSAVGELIDRHRPGAVAEYAPSEVKQAVVGYGKADKAQIQEMVRLILGLATVPHPDDAADALAVAICHVQRAPFRSRV